MNEFQEISAWSRPVVVSGAVVFTMSSKCNVALWHGNDQTYYAIQDTAPILAVFYSLFFSQDIDIVIQFVIFTLFLQSFEIQLQSKKNIIGRSAQGAPLRQAPWGSCLTGPLVVTPLCDRQTDTYRQTLARSTYCASIASRGIKRQSSMRIFKKSTKSTIEKTATK